MGVQDLRVALQEAAIRFTALRTLESMITLDRAAEEFGEAKRRSRVRRDKWRERKEVMAMGDGVKTCRVQDCRVNAEWRPVLSFPPFDGGEDRIKVETVMLDVCDQHAHELDAACYTENPAVWAAVVQVWTANNLPAPDPEDAQLDYLRIDPEIRNHPHD